MAGGPNNGSRWTIDYRPWLRMYRIEYTAPGETKVLHRMIPESWASAEFYE